MNEQQIDKPTEESVKPKIIRVTFFVNAAEGLVYLLGADGEGHKYLKDNVDLNRGCIFLCKLPQGCMFKKEDAWRFIDTSFYPIKWQIEVYEKIAYKLLFKLQTTGILEAVKNREITLNIQTPKAEDQFFESRYRKFDIAKNDVMAINADELDLLYRSLQPFNLDGSMRHQRFAGILYKFDHLRKLIELEGIREPWRKYER